MEWQYTAKYVYKILNTGSELIAGIMGQTITKMLNNASEHVERIKVQLTWPQRVDLRVGLVAIARSSVIQCSTVALVQP